MPRIIFGTRNRHKVLELTDLMHGVGLEFSDMSSWPDLPDIEETGQTFEENARLKAVGFAAATREWVLAEDSGLSVPVLKGRPGVFSARFAGTHGDDSANNAKLLKELATFEDSDRDAYYVCVAAVSDPSGKIVAIAEGRCHGRIVKELRGTSGFGYDPLFLIQEYHKTFGELSPLVKTVLSHRARAIAQLRPIFRQIAGT
jgi:XTP/dITP diphosphohydrolase